MPSIDRTRLASLIQREQRKFVDERPKSKALFERARRSLLAVSGTLSYSRARSRLQTADSISLPSFRGLRHDSAAPASVARVA
jgi:hypothetical protein